MQEKRKAILESRLAKVRERKLKQKLEESTTAGPDGASQAIADFGDFDKGPTEGSKEENKMERNEGDDLVLLYSTCYIFMCQSAESARRIYM